MPRSTVKFTDSEKALFGAGNDLEVYHDGANSYISDQGTGNLFIQGSGVVVIEDPDGNNMIYAEDGGEVILYHNASNKLETIATGVNITGGIRLGGNNAANELDDYEEGTWLPGIEFATAGGTASTATSSYTTGGYTKIGKAVCVEFNISNLSFGNGTGSLKLTGLPFTPSGTGAYSGKLNASSGHLVPATTASGYLDIVKLYGTSTGYRFMYSTGNSGAGAWNDITNSNASTISLNSVNGSFTYFTAS